MVKGIGSGPTTIKVQEFANDTAIDVAAYTDIAFSTTTIATFTVGIDATEEVRVMVDVDGDGEPNYIVADDASALTLEELFFNLKDLIINLEVKENLKKQFLKKIEKLEKKIAEHKKKKVSKAISNMEKKVVKKGGRGKLSDAAVEEILILLEEIERMLL